MAQTLESQVTELRKRHRLLSQAAVALGILQVPLALYLLFALISQWRAYRALYGCEQAVPYHLFTIVAYLSFPFFVVEVLALAWLFRVLPRSYWLMILVTIAPLPLVLVTGLALCLG